MINPFTPAMGTVPYEMAGRKDIMSELDYAFDNAPGDPALTTILIGPRGTGKTALLSYYSKKIPAEGWIAVSASCLEGMLEDIYQQAMKAAKHLMESSKKNTKQKKHLKIAIAGIIEGGIESETDNSESLNWRSRMEDLLDALNEQGIGLLITVDEIVPDVDEIVQLTSIYQHWVSDGRKVALLMAGLPFNIEKLLDMRGSSFLRRANQKHIGRIDDHDIKDAFRTLVDIGKKQIGEEALTLATKSCEGSPYLMQLIGYRTWIKTGDRTKITKDDVENGIELATRDYETRALDSTLRELTAVDIAVLKALKDAGGEAYMAELATNMGKTSSYMSNYKRKLLKLGIIEEFGKNRVGFALPHLKEYLEQYEDAK